ncbi:hypothetical protein O181_062926 [Austropuccinia psidii MF-1]|uniref:Uncharacterized protein n=1 Tax=Austropuccinia psidii MF-1 TaxID=1389203 RepID=A0A9Q3HYX4_9BASI|nr:hypothetical protein [Austropuccinia psidii MF-1]
MSTPLNKNEGAGFQNPQVLDVETSQLKNEFSTSFHNLELSMAQALLKGVPKLEEWPHFSGEGEYDHMELIIAHRLYIKLRLAHGHQSWTWWKTQIINKWANDSWRFKVETAFESSQFNSDKDKSLPWFFQQEDRLTALYTDMSEFMIQRKILRQCGGDLDHAVKSRTTEKSSAEDIINILEEVTTRTRIGSSRVNVKTRFNTPWKDSVDKNPKENSDNIKYKSADVMRKFNIFQSTTHLANTCPQKGKINEIDIEKDESYSHLPQLSNGQLDLSRIHNAQQMKTKPNRGKGYTAGNSCITGVVIDRKPTKLLLDPGSFCTCVGKSLLEIQITVKKVSPDNLELEKLKSEQLNEAEITLHRTDKQESELYALLYDHKEAFESDKEPLGAIFGHEADIILNIKRPYPLLLRRPAYPASHKSREALEIHIKELLDLGVIRKVGHNEEVEITTPVIVAWNNGKSRMFGDFRALNTYTVPDRYPIPKIHISLTQISQEVYISTMDALKRFQKNVVKPRARK